jgi:hypothetical protein
MEALTREDPSPGSGERIRQKNYEARGVRQEE